ncbi:extracellular solute-binding protein [Paenibacillus koleovorans]|uniref:extracellular solute-binding protein n=1 Tax=Paenibacillus koleovorans TaxID=121608 RepID=UPI000FD7229D|nr:extracellular solute-binding protein [Paenibacillus koleovorans]
MEDKFSRKTFRLRLEEMTRTLREDILSGKRPPGEFLPSEQDLARQFHISNKTVRKGLEVLQQEGLIEKMPKIGSRVANPSTDGRVVIRFGYHGTLIRELGMAQLLADFHRRYPHIRVQPLEIPRDRYFRFVNDCMESGMLDLVTINQHNFQEFSEKGKSVLFEPQQEQPGMQPFLASTFRSGSRTFAPSATGELLAQPLVFSPIILCYNKDHFADAGLLEPDSSWTWNTLLDAAERLAVENERFGFYFHLFSTNRWPIFLLQCGDRFQRDASGNYSIAGTRLLDGLELCRKIVSMPHVFPALLSGSDADAEELFLQGKVSMILTTYFGLNDLKHASITYDVAPVPHLNEFKTLLAVIGLAMNRKTDNREAVKTFAEYLLSYESQLSIRRNTYSLPALKAAADWEGQESLTRPSRFHMYREIIPTFKPFTDLGLTTEQLEDVFREAKWYWSKLQDKSTACKRIEAGLNGQG